MIYFDEKKYVIAVGSQTDKQFDYRKVCESGKWKEWQQDFRQKLAEITGLTLIRQQAAGIPLAPRLEERLEVDGYIREKRYITSEAGVEIPFYLLLPTRTTGQVPLVLCPHGHGRRGKEVYIGNFSDEWEREDSLNGDRDIAVQAVLEGYAVIAPDVRGFWEMARKEEVDAEKNNSCEELQRRSLMLGRTLIGERVHDMGRLLDYASTLPEIDMNKVMITGNSGGGTVSLFTAALDERITLAAPASYFCTFSHSIMSVYHCICNVIPGILQYGEMYDVAGLIAPRPMLMINGEKDPLFPIEGVRIAFEHIRNIYEQFDAADRCELFVGNGGHRYYKGRVWDFVKEQW